MSWCVYFVRRASGEGPIKIGCTSALKFRLVEIAADWVRAS